MNDPRFQALLDQLDTILLFMERPVVQHQLFAFVLIFLISWLLPAPLGKLLNKLIAQQDAISEEHQEQGLPINVWRIRVLRWARGAQLLLFPIVGLISSQLTISYFASQSRPLGLLERLAMIFWLVLIHQFIGSILFGSLPTVRARAYHHRLITPAFVILAAISLGAGLAGAFPIVRVELFRIMGTPLTLTTIVTAALVLYATITVGWVTNEALRNLVLPRVQADSGVTNTILIIARYTIIGIGVLFSLSILGVDLSAFAIIGGGLSVGIGFGLQDLVANFISGILLLFEQTLRPGDIIEVGGQRGRVDQMRMRSAVLRTAENVEVYVPNKTLLTSTVAAYTHMKPSTRRTLKVGVSYDSDPVEVRTILQSVVEEHGLVLDDPAPVVFFSGFGSYTLDFEVAISVSEPGRADQVLSDLHFIVYGEFSKRGIEIPIAQQDFNLRTAISGPIEQLLSGQFAEASQQVNGRPKNDQPTSMSQKGAGEAAQQITNSAATTGVDRALTLPSDHTNVSTERPKLAG